MRVQKRGQWLRSLGVALAAIVLWGAQAQGQACEGYVSDDKPGSVAIWPKVIADGTRDTLITLTNTRNELAFAHCEYVQALGICSTTEPLQFCIPRASSGSPDDCPGTDVCVEQWQSADFEVVLTRQQPTMWRVSTGRVWNPFLVDNSPPVNCNLTGGLPPLQQCPGLFTVGLVPPAPDQPFRGELKCIQVATDGSALTSNALKGEAVIEALGVVDTPFENSKGQISKYNSINVEGCNPPAIDDLIRLNGVEYAACPEAVEVSHYMRNQADIVAGGLGATCTGSGCQVNTEITVIPCRQDFVINDDPEPGANSGTAFVAAMLYTDEFEFTPSVDEPAQCWFNFDLRDFGFASTSSFQRTRIIPSGSNRCILGNFNAVCANDAACGPGGVCAPTTGVLAIVEEFHTSDAPTGPAFIGTAASNGYAVDLNNDGRLGRAGRCRGQLTRVCTANSQCLVSGGGMGGICRYTSNTCTSDSQCVGDDPENFCDLCMNDEINFLIEPVVQQNP